MLDGPKGRRGGSTGPRLKEEAQTVDPTPCGRRDAVCATSECFYG